MVDSALHDVRARAAALDPGKKLMAQIQELTVKMNEVETRQKQVHGEQTDLELAQKAIDEKLKKIDSDLYGGKVVNPREVENLEREVVLLKRRKQEQDDRLLELMQVAEPVAVESAKLEAAVAELKQLLAHHQRQVLAEKSKLETAFKDHVALRPSILSEVPAAMLPRYDSLLKKLGTAMSRITRERSCEACGLALSEKTIESAKEDRVVNCEQCHRILYYSEGVV